MFDRVGEFGLKKIKTETNFHSGTTARFTATNGK